MRGQYTLPLGIFRSPQVEPERFAIYQTDDDVAQGVARISLGRGLFTVIDYADVHLVADYSWFAENRGGNTGWYAVRNARKGEGDRLIRMHQVIVGTIPDGLEIDHIDCDGLNNRRGNLRVVDHTLNQRNKRLSERNTSGYVGVSFHKKSGRWRADINVNGRQKSLGTFTDPIDAAAAYDNAVRKYHGGIGRVNFPRRNELGAA